MTKWISAEQFQTYLQTASRADRVAFLKSLRQSHTLIPLTLTKELFLSPVSAVELSFVLDVTGAESKIEFEFWVFENLLKWPQDLAAAALRVWSQVTDCVLWHRLLPVLRLPGLPQRLHYCILDISQHFAGVDITTAALTAHGWEDYSPAYHGLLFDRAIQFSVESKRLDSLATKILTSAQMFTHPEDKSLQSAVAWLLRVGESKKLLTMTASKPEASWKHMTLSAVARHEERKKDLERAQKMLAKPQLSLGKWKEEWPAPWSRQGVTVELAQGLLKLAVSESDIDIAPLMSGCSTISLTQAFGNLTHEEQRRLIGAVRGYLLQTNVADVVSSFRAVIDVSENDWLATLDQPELKQERAAMLSLQSNMGSTTLNSARDLTAIKSDVRSLIPHAASPFFAALQGQPLKDTTTKVSDFWSKLAFAWSDPKTCDLAVLATESRKQKGIATLCYIATLGKMIGNDEAVLKTLDHIRSKEEDELRAITAALGTINTTRSLQELIAIITRPNATVAIQQEVVAILGKRDVSALQKELRATVRDLQVPTDPTSVWLELREALSNLIQTSNVDVSDPAMVSQGGINDKKLDDELSGRIPNYRELSSEVRRALRTALFFNQSIAGSESSHAIDLSPLIDMQYKAMELLFREFFEDPVSQALQRGDIPRKLDVIGYARPIPQKMDEFEAYIANLPVVREIPFFSKFKLRKMLRAICQFEPGRRFTLDGLKAFGLFFLCFSRRDCRFGLANQFPIGIKDDRDLAEFAKELHVFQDFRNRAAHEGFHPEASNDIQGIWRTTALIVQWAFRIRDELAHNHAAKNVAKAS